MSTKSYQEMGSNGTNDYLEAALDYCRRGWAVIEVPLGEKCPTRKDWSKRWLRGEDEVVDAFSVEHNIGILLGRPSEWIVDVDLDCTEAIIAADILLSDLGETATFGREGKRRSHKIFAVDGPIQYAKYSDPLKPKDDERRTICELRATGQQTIFPPSIHKGTNERIEWDGEADVQRVMGDQLSRLVGRIAPAVLLGRNWPKGDRHEAAKDLAGGLLRADWKVDEVLTFVEAVVAISGDEEPDDRYRVVQDTAEKLERGDKKITGWKDLKKRFGEHGEIIVNTIFEWLDIEQGNQSSRLVSLARSEIVELWHDDQDRPWATIRSHGNRAHYHIESKTFTMWLTGLIYQQTGRVPGAQTIADVARTLAAQALFDSERYETFVRVAEHEGSVYIDLGDETWRAIEIDTDGWRIIDEPPIRFRRHRGLKELPEPKRNGSRWLWRLRWFVNVESDEDFRLLLTVLTQFFLPTGPYPVLVLAGEQGSAKSTVSKILKVLLDPNVAQIRSAPREERDLAIAANNSWLVAYDNLSGIPSWLSDGLCRLATGGGFGTRLLYSDDDEALFDSMRPVLMNGIGDIVTRPDLLDRAVSINLSVIPDEKRKDERRFWRVFNRAKPFLLGELLDLLVVALNERPKVRTKHLPRMADFTITGIAISEYLGWSAEAFVERYDESRDDADDVAIQDSVVVPELRAVVTGDEGFKGQASELLERLNHRFRERGTARPSNWPKNARGLSQHLRKIAPVLRRKGWTVQFDREGGQRLIEVVVPPAERAKSSSEPDDDEDDCEVDEHGNITLTLWPH